MPGQCSFSFRTIHPGTFKALSDILNSHDLGDFDLVHLDMHGLVRNEQ